MLAELNTIISIYSYFRAALNAGNTLGTISENVCIFYINHYYKTMYMMLRPTSLCNTTELELQSH